MMSCWHMPVNKKIQLNWSVYLLQTFFCIYFLVSPILLSYYFDVENPNNTSYNIEIISKHFLKTIAIVLSLTYIITLPFLFLKLLFRKVYASLVFVFIYSASILDFLHVFIFKSRANSSSFFSIFSTNQNETLEFVLDYSSSNLLLGLIGLLLFPYLIYFFQKKINN